MVRRWLAAYLERRRARQARAFRHAFAPRLEAWREIEQLPDPQPKKTAVPFLNLRVMRSARKVA